MKKLLTYISAIILALASIISLWFLLNNLQPLSPGLFSFTALFLLAVGISFKLFGGNIVTKAKKLFIYITSLKYFTLIALPLIVLVGIAVRSYFYQSFSYFPISDPITFFDAAQKIAAGGSMQGDTYATFFPFLAAYNAILGGAMSVIHDPWLAIIVLNTSFDIAAALGIYFIVKLLVKPGSKLPVLGFVVWLLSPFTILFSLVSLPVPIVSFFIIISILLSLLLVKALQAKRIAISLLLGVLLGITLSLGNAFRPVFVIMLVALFVVFVYLFLIDKKRPKFPVLLGSVFVILVALFMGAQHLHLAWVESQTGIKPAANSSGWNIYVGSNSESNGKWSREDEIRMSALCADTKNYEECHKILRDEAVKRYKSQGPVGVVNLFVRKLYIFSSNQSNVYNANLSVKDYAGSTAQKVFNIYLTLFLMTLFLLNVRFFYMTTKTTLKNKQLPAGLLFLGILILGFFLSAILVEVSERYAQILYPIFVIIAMLSLGLQKAKAAGKS